MSVLFPLHLIRMPYVSVVIKYIFATNKNILLKQHIELLFHVKLAKKVICIFIAFFTKHCYILHYQIEYKLSKAFLDDRFIFLLANIVLLFYFKRATTFNTLKYRISSSDETISSPECIAL